MKLHPFLPLVACATAAIAADQMTLQGSGATFPAPLYARWIETYNAAHGDVHVDYQAIGSGGGIKGITDRTVVFAGSDAPLTDEQLKQTPAAVLHLPTVAGPVAMIVDLPDLKSVTLDAATIAGMYLGKITTWDDEHLKAINPGVKLPHTDVAVVHRSDGSGTSWIFTNYLSKVSPAWKGTVGNATSVKWPTGLGGKGNAGVAEAVRNTPGAVGYVELAYAKSSKLEVCPLINKAGKQVVPSIDGVVAAAENSGGELPADLRLSITDAPGDASYPICGFTYLLVYQDLSYLKDEAKARKLVSFIEWCEHAGQAMAKDLDYAKLSDAMQKRVDAKLESVVFDGKPLMRK